MHRARPSEDPARRWRTFCRAGGRWAFVFAALWFGGLTLLFRVSPVPAAALRAAPAQLGWWSASGGAALDVRAQWTPAAFALSTPAGFSRSLRGERAGLAPPIQAERLPAAYLDDARAFEPLDVAEPGRLGAEAQSAPGGSTPDEGVFPPRAPEPEIARMVFPDGWESRLFSGIDLDFRNWTKAAWDARVEMRFDGKGVPESILLAQASGVPEVDRRLARSASGWRLLEPAAPRTGVVAWQSPAAAEGSAP